VGEDSAAFDLAAQSARSWTLFFGLLAFVLGLVYTVWVAPGSGLADDFLATLEGLTSNSEATMLLILFVFAVAHSGLAFLRPYGEAVVGARAYRVAFALISLPLAALAVFYFINHRYDGMPLWNVRQVVVRWCAWVFFTLRPASSSS
jgi:zeta-carotene isomerase